MLKKMDVPTRLSKEFINKYLNKDAPVLMPFKQPKKHTPHFSNVLCKFFAKGQCVRGDECIFSHEISQFICPNQSTFKSCSRVSCQYKHDLADSNFFFNPSNTLDNPLDNLKERKNFISPF